MHPVIITIVVLLAVFGAGLYAAYRITKGGQEAGRVEGDK